MPQQNQKGEDPERMNRRLQSVLLLLLLVGVAVATFWGLVVLAANVLVASLAGSIGCDRQSDQRRAR